jgi:hypothetical protein
LMEMRTYPNFESHWWMICDEDIRAKVLTMGIRD